MATASLVALPRAVFYDANGKPLAGGLVYTYVPGGTVSKTTWQDAGETTPNSNPITLDGDGSCLIYGSGNYQLTVTDALGNAIPAYSGLTGGLAAAAGISTAMQPVVSASTTAQAGQLLGVPSVVNIAALRAATAAALASPIFVQGYYSGADGGEGTFWLKVADATSSDNGGTIIVDAAGNRWYRETEGQKIAASWFGCVGDGTTDDAAALVAADTFAHSVSKTLSIVGTGGMVLKVASPQALASTLDFTAGGQIAPATGITLTVNGAIIAGATQIFGGLGTITGSTASAPTVLAAWFGCVGDDTTDDSAALTRAATFASAIGRSLTICGTKGFTLAVASSISLGSLLNFTGAGRLSPNSGVVISITGAILATAQKLFVGSGAVTLTGQASVDALVTWWGAVGDATTNNAAAINAAILSLYNGPQAGGKLRFPAGVFLATSTITVKGAVILEGAGRDSTLLSCGATGHDINLLYFDGTSSYAGCRDMFITGNQSGSATANLIQMDKASIGGQMVNCNVWGGYSAVFAQCTDWDFDNCFIAGWAEACLSSAGANWYRRCKFDSAGAGTIAAAFLQGAYAAGSQVCENHFEQCDFSGSFTNSVLINDVSGTEAITIFEGCVFSAGIQLQKQVFSSFVGCEIGSTSFNLSNGSASVVGCYAFSSMTITGASKAGNVNIS